MEKVAKKILDDAEKERKELLNSANEEVAQIKKQTEAELSKLEKETDALVQAALSRDKHRILGMATLSIRNELLQMKRELIANLFDEALESLVSKDKSAYLSLVKSLLRQVEVKEGELIVGKEETRIDHKFIEEVNNELGAKFSLSEEKAQIKGGFILRYGKIEIDSSFSGILKSSQSKIELELAKLLFKS